MKQEEKRCYEKILFMLIGKNQEETSKTLTNMKYKQIKQNCKSEVKR